MPELQTVVFQCPQGLFYAMQGTESVCEKWAGWVTDGSDPEFIATDKEELKTKLKERGIDKFTFLKPTLPCQTQS